MTQVYYDNADNCGIVANRWVVHGTISGSALTSNNAFNVIIEKP